MILRASIVTLVSILLAAPPTPCQSPSASPGELGGEFVTGPVEGVRVMAADPSDGVLPRNISSPSYLRPLLLTMLRRSATFRHQCEVIDGAEHARITLRLTIVRSGMYRALTRVTRRANGLITMSMEFPAPGDFVEVIGHEFEHAVEQLEGIDLKAMSERCHDAYVTADGAYETIRAIRAGRAVLKEFRSHERERRGNPAKPNPASQSWPPNAQMSKPVA